MDEDEFRPPFAQAIRRLLAPVAAGVVHYPEDPTS
jgi:hypothetical protein